MPSAGKGAARRPAARPPRAAGLAALAAALLGLLAAGCVSPSAARPADAAAAAHPASFRPATSPVPTPSATPPATARPSGGPTVIPAPLPPAGLPQTRAFPRASGAVFGAEMTDLWAAVVTGKAALAGPSFFPEAAYTRLKAIYGPAADWQGRLLGDFRLDVAAAHRYLEPGAARARLLRVIVPSAEAAWISPGVCANSIGYWHVGGARLVYRQGGRVRSIGIASLISWRGRWYVVHFGAVLRGGSYGLVDEPAAGPGVPGPPGGC
jgi:hypothetical protein